MKTVKSLYDYAKRNITYNHTLLACEDEVVYFNENIETPEFNEILRSNKVNKEFWLC